MKPIPNSIKERISHAKYYLEAADKHPAPTKDAVHILLLLIGWENIAIADEELGAWAKEEDVDKQIYKSHARKFRKMPEVTRIILGSTGTKTREERFSSGKKFEKLRMVCQYGSNAETKEVRKLFKSGWHLDSLKNKLVSKIRWIETLVIAYEELNKRKDAQKITF